MSFFFVRQVVAVAKAFDSEDEAFVKREFRREVQMRGRGEPEDFIGKRLCNAVKISHETLAVGEGGHALIVAVEQLARSCPRACGGCHRLNLELRQTHSPSTLTQTAHVYAGCVARHQMDCPAGGARRVAMSMRPGFGSFEGEYPSVWSALPVRSSWLAKMPPEEAWQNVEIGLELEGSPSAPDQAPQPAKPATPTDLVW